jgi:uncharacterized protein
LPSSIDLLDANVWLALAAEAHTHHNRAKLYWQNEAAPAVGFCRVTQLAFLRHLTNKSIMGSHVLLPAEAWKKWEQFLELPEVKFLTEPLGLNEELMRFSNLGRTSQNLWTDAYLAAFAKCADVRFVSFDSDFLNFKGLETLILRA